MANLFQSVRGFNDVLPVDSAAWQQLYRIAGEVFAAYGYGEIKLPLLEHTALFKRSIGEVTDIVEKEMFSFVDREGDSLTLRPEGTASCVRAGLEHGLLHNQQQRLWYAGPMRSEEHTSELQSLMRISYAVFCLKKKHNKTKQAQNHTQKSLKSINEPSN